MTGILKMVFWLSLFMLFYIYLGYPLVIWLLSRFRNSGVRKQAFFPKLTILIAAYNERDCIAATLSNKIAQDYPRDQVQIIVVSDGSTDGTDEIVESFSAQGVRLIRQHPRAGKTAALNMAVPHAEGDILVFSDANSIYAPDALKKLVHSFSDPSIGYVTGKMIYTQADGSAVGDGCSFYMKYENRLREWETRLGSIVGVDGGIDAVRRELYTTMRPDQLPDFVLPLQVVMRGKRVVYEPEAVLRESTLGNSSDEYRMRVRVALRAYWALSDMRHLLSFKRQPLFGFQLWSHKVLRYAAFLFLITAYAANLSLWGQGRFFEGMLVLQSLAYALAGFAPVLERRNLRLWLADFMRYFILLNLASAHAFGKFVLGRKQVVWQPRKG